MSSELPVPEPTCPECGSSSLEYAGGTVTYLRSRKLAESRYRCGNCGHEFTETVEPEDRTSFPMD